MSQLKLCTVVVLITGFKQWYHVYFIDRKYRGGGCHQFGRICNSSQFPEVSLQSGLFFYRQVYMFEPNDLLAQGYKCENADQDRTQTKCS